MPIVSVDLAYKHYRDVGVAVLESGPAGAGYELVDLAPAGDPAPDPPELAEMILAVARRRGAMLLVLDGPQAWRDPANGLVHSRRCDRLVNAPAKVGLPGAAKPRNYLGFVTFAVAVFDALHARGWPRFDPLAWSPGRPAAVESLPLAAWRSLGLKCLPAKARCRAADVAQHLEWLTAAGRLAPGAPPTHDQLQALVAGLAGLALEGTPDRYVAAGAAPFVLDGHWREGYIVNPL